jgi:predicted nucleic acid-binding protein
MKRFVIDAQVALGLAQRAAELPADHVLLAPTLLRSQVLSLLFAAVRAGELDHKAASQRLDYLRGLKMRLLGDRTLQRVAWKIADERGWPDTFVAEYIALTQLQADSFVTLDDALASQVRDLVAVSSIDQLLGKP